MRRVVGTFLWVTGSRVLDAAVRFLTVPLILAHFDKAEFGLLALAYSVNVFLAIADFGLNINAVRRLSDHLVANDWVGMRQLVHSCSFYYSCVGFINLLLVLALGLVSKYLFNLTPSQAHTFLWLTLSLGLSSWLNWSFVIHRQVIQAAGQIGWDERNMIGATVGNVVLVALTLKLNLGLETYFAWSLAIGVFPVVMRLWKLRSLSPELTIGFKPDWLLFKPLVNSSLMIFLLSLAQMFASNMRPLILANRGTLEAVADYRVLQGVVSFALMVSGAVLSVVYPEVARMEASGQTSRLREFSVRGTSLLLWGHFILLLPLALSAGSILQVYVGHDYAQLGVALGVWLLTCAAGHNAIYSSIILSRGRLGALTVSSIVNSVVTLGLAYWMTPAYGLSAVVWTYVLFTVLQALFWYVYLLPSLGMGTLRESAQIVVRPVFAAAASGAIAIAAVQSTSLPLWVAAPLALVMLVALGLWMGGIWADLRFFKHVRAH